MPPTDLPVHRFRCPDGVELAWREVGSGRPFVLLHGLMGSGARLAAQGLVLALSERGYRVIVGDRDSRGASAASLAALLPRGQLVMVPGDHGTALEAPEFTTTVLEFLRKSLC